MAQGRQLRGRPHGASHEARLLWGGVGSGHLAGQLCRPLVEGKGLVGDVVFSQHQRGGPEGVGFDHIAARLQKLAMHCLHSIGAGENQIFIAALKGSAAEIIGAQIHLLQRGACGTVEHQHRPLRPMEALKKADSLNQLGGYCRSHVDQPSTRIRVTQWS